MPEYLRPPELDPEPSYSGSEKNQGEEEGERERNNTQENYVDPDLPTEAQILGLSMDDLLATAKEEGVSLEGLEGREAIEDALLDNFGLLQEDGKTANDNWMDTLPDDAKKLIHSKLQGVAELRVKARLADALAENPEAIIRSLAQRYGIGLASNQGQNNATGQNNDPFASVGKVEMIEGEEPQSYIGRVVGEYMKAGFAAISQQQRQAQSRGVQRGNTPFSENQIVETMRALDEKYSDWMLYEDKMLNLVTQDPSLLRKPDELYAKASGRKIRRAASQNRRNRNRKPAARTGQRSTTGSPRKLGARGGFMSFAEAWKDAEQQFRSY